MARGCLILAFVCLLAACIEADRRPQTVPPSTGSAKYSGATLDPTAAVERYLKAKAAGDGETIRRLLCRQMEADFERERRSFEGVSDARLEGVACRSDSEGLTVRCQGKIVAAYGGEQSEFPLSAYRVIWEDGEWKWCGQAP